MPSLRLRPASRSGRSPLTATLPALRATLDGLDTNVFVCDLEYQLVYVNRCAVRTARSFEPQLRAALGVGLGVGLGELLFGSIHRFHEDPARIGRILRDPRNFPYRGSFRFEGVVLLGDVNALTDEDGEVIGYCVAWRDITEQAGVAAAPTEQTSASLREVSGTVSSAVAVAADAVAAAEAATERIGQLSPSSQQLGSVVQLLSGIATQTSLLALNATLEAARAGQAGTGSAVVAGEVEDLAQETAAATRRITERITALREDGAQATASIEGVAALSSSVGEVADVAGTAGTPPGRVTRRD